MKKITLAIGGITLLWLMWSGAYAKVSPLIGQWENLDKRAKGLTKLTIAGSGPRLTMQAWGQCAPQDCDWGRTLGVVYAAPIAKESRGNSVHPRALVGMFTTNHGEKFVVAKPTAKYRLRVEVYTRFRNQSQNNFIRHYVFRQENQPLEEEKEAITPTHAALKAPQQTSPRNGKVFFHYPRRTTLKWKTVPDATSYSLEIDCYHCCRYKRWCSDLGNEWKQVNKLQGTSYTFNFIGPQPGRWRVWAIDKDGHPGKKSPWRQFRFRR